MAKTKRKNKSFNRIKKLGFSGMRDEVLIGEIESIHGSSESSRVYLSVDRKDGESEIVIEKTFTERYPVTDFNKVLNLHRNLNRGGGRRAWTLEELAK